jgi:hypothetical protein
VHVRNADPTRTAGYPVQLDVDDSDCGGGVAATPDFQSSTPGAQNVITIADGSTKTARILLTVNAAVFTSVNRNAPHRCTLHFTASAVVSGGSVDPMPANNTLPVELNVVDKNDPNQTTMHETTIASLNPVTLTIAAGQTAKIKTVRPSVGNADAGELPGDFINTVVADGTCPPGTVGALTFLGVTSPVMVRGGAHMTGTLPLTMTSAQVHTPNKLSPQRCVITVSAAGPGGDSEPTNNTTQMAIDGLDQGDY